MKLQANELAWYQNSWNFCEIGFCIYDNENVLIIDIYFYEFFLPLKPQALALQNIWDTLSDVF